MSIILHYLTCHHCCLYRKHADIAPLLDVDDMVKMQKPDWKCVFTYVQSFYRKLSDHPKNSAAAPKPEQ